MFNNKTPTGRALFESLGYLQSEPRPTYRTLGLIKVKDGLWTVIEVTMQGSRNIAERVLITPTVRSLAIECYKREIVKKFMEGFDE